MRLLADPDALAADPAGQWLGREGFFSTLAWWRAVWAAGVPPGAMPLFAIHGTGTATALFALLRQADGAMAALTNPYTCLWQPACGPDADLRAAGAALARLAGGILRLDALDPDWSGLAALLAGARATGRAALRFDHFGNWHEAVPGGDWHGYLAARPGALRATVRRRLRAAMADPALAFAMLATPDEVEAGIAEYEAVYARSWKEPEPFPRFNAELMRAAARDGTLRLAILRHAGAPIAVQLWILRDRTAAVQKLAHDEDFKPLSPGTVLTAWTLQRLIEADGARDIDFGRGDDPYKQLWTAHRRQRIGVVLAAPWRAAGLAAVLRHAAGRLRRRLRRPDGSA